EQDLPGGCLMLAASVEYDDRPGSIRELLVAGQRELRGAIAKAIRLAIEAGHLRTDTDPWQLAFDLFGVVLAAHHDRRLLADARALDRARAAFERLIGNHAAGAHPCPGCFAARPAPPRHPDRILAAGPVTLGDRAADPS